MTRIILFSASFVVLLTATPAAAENRKKPMVNMENVAVPARQAPAPKAEEKLGPTMTLEEFTGRQEARIQEINNQQIVYLQKLIELASPEDPQLPDYLFRLGELFAERSRYWNNRARSLDEAIFREAQQQRPSDHGERR